MAERQPLTPLDLALGEGTHAQRRELSARIARDPEVAGELGETFDLLQQIRGVAVPLQPGFVARMIEVERTHRGWRAARARRWRSFTLAAAAAALLLTTLAFWPARHAAPWFTFTTANASYIGERDLEAQMQRLAASLAMALPQQLDEASTEPKFVARAASALIASGQAHNGARFGPDLHAASLWLEQRLPALHDGPLASSLAALSEVAATTGGAVPSLQLHGRRFVDESLAGLDRAASTGLFATDTAVGDLADAGRLLAIAPAFDIDAAAAARLRQALAERLAARCRSDDPAVLAALLYGYADLVDRDAMDRQRHDWRPTVIAATDLPTLHQFAASLEPGMRGRAEFLLRMRQLATCPVPAAPTTQADLLLCLASSSFLSRSCSFSRVVAFASRP